MGAAASIGVFTRAMLGSSAGRVRRFLTRHDVREYELLSARYAGFPRFKEVGLRIGGYDLLVPDMASFLSSWSEIFLHAVYDWPNAPPCPRILDLGANIGISVLHHKKLYPDAQITAFEADPAIFAYLQRNLEANQVRDVTLINKAAWDQDGTVTFCSEGADGGRIDLDQGAHQSTIVETVDIAEVLRGQLFDFIKMDIEGAELRVLPRCRALMAQARAAFVEFHAPVTEPHRLSVVLGELEGAGFRTYIKPLYVNPKPFAGPIVSHGFDQQLNLFAIRQA